MSENQAKNPEKLTVSFAMPHASAFAKEEGEKRMISGYAATYDAFSEDMGGYRTRLAKGCFDRVLQASDCRFLFNHDPNLLFGRTKSGTLRLVGDDKGLRFENDHPRGAIADQYYDMVARGDMDGCSFTCDIDIDQWDFSGETPIRTLVGLSMLYDVGPVTYPAFSQTLAVSHALEAARASLVIKMLRPGLGLMRLGLDLAC